MIVNLIVDLLIDGKYLKIRLNVQYHRKRIICA